MRTEFINLFAALNEAELETLKRETKETVATHNHLKNAKPGFIAANLWNIHNMKRPIASRRNSIA